MTTDGITNGYSGHFRTPDFPMNELTLGGQTFYPHSPREVKRRLAHDLCIYDTLIWGDGENAFVIMRLPFHRYRVTGADGRTERLGGRNATYALSVLLKRLGLD